MLDNEINQSFELDFDIYSSLNGKFKNFKGKFDISSNKAHENEVGIIVESAMSIYNNMCPHLSCDLMTTNMA